MTILTFIGALALSVLTFELLTGIQKAFAVFGRGRLSILGDSLATPGGAQAGSLTLSKIIKRLGNRLDICSLPLRLLYACFAPALRLLIIGARAMV